MGQCGIFGKHISHAAGLVLLVEVQLLPQLSNIQMQAFLQGNNIQAHVAGEYPAVILTGHH